MELGELNIHIGDGNYSSKYPKNSEFIEDGVPFISASDFQGRVFIEAGMKHISKEQHAVLLKGHLKPRDILIVVRGNGCGKVGYVPEEYDDANINAQLALLRCDNQMVNSEYLYYLLSTSEYQNKLKALCSGSAQPQLPIKSLKKLQLELLSYDIQLKIANLAKQIDDKILNNNAINRNLQEQAQAYYDELFITNCKPKWKTGSLSDIGTIVAGGTPSKRKEEYYADEGIAWITPRDLSNDHSMFISRGEINISEIGYKNSSATKMPPGTVLFSSRAPIGYIAIAANEVTTNQGFKSVVPNDNVGTPYIYFLLQQLLPIIEGMASGSTFKEISGAGMKAVPTVIPDDETLRVFNEFCKPLFRRIQSLETENKRLASIRDALLPKLMSGELDVSGIDI